MSLTLRPHDLWPTRLLCPWYFSGKDTGLPFSPPGHLPNPRNEPHLLHWQVDSLPPNHQGILLSACDLCLFYTHSLPLSSCPNRRWFGSRSWMSFICENVRVFHPFSGLSCLSDLQHTDELHYLRQYTGLACVCPSPRSPRVDLVARPASSVFLCVISTLQAELTCVMIVCP